MTKVLTKSVLISAAVHLAAAVVLFSRPLHLYPRFFAQFGKTPLLFLEEENIAILKRNQALDEAFSYFETQETVAPYPKTIGMQELESHDETAPPLPAITLALPEFQEMPLLSLPSTSLTENSGARTQPAAISSFEPVLVEPSFTPFISAPLYDVPIQTLPEPLDTSPSFDFIPSQESARSLALTPKELPAPKNVDSIAPLLEAPSFIEVPREPVLTAHSDFSTSPTVPRSIIGIRGTSSLGEYGLPALEIKEWNEFFDVDVKTYAQEEGGFLFSVHITPRMDLSEQRLLQNYLFVIDRSHSIDKHHYQTAKRATSRAISALRPGDSFNILILGSTVSKLDESLLPFSKVNQGRAEAFLEKESHRHHGAAADVYTTLTQILSSAIQTQEAITAILISDGDSPLKSGEQRKKINQWLEANRDRVTLYAATAGHGNNLSSLKMLSLASRGSLLYSDTHAAFPRKLAKLVMDLRYPLAKEMTVSILMPEGLKPLELLPPSSRLPNLFSNHPYVLFGSTDKLTDFTLILEGKNKDQTFTIKKIIPLSKAKQGSRLLVKQWETEKAHTLFDQYLREGEATLLKQAEKQLHHDAQNSRR